MRTSPGWGGLLLCGLILGKGYSLGYLPHGFYLRLLALPKNWAVISTEPLTCEFGPVPSWTAWCLGAPVALSLVQASLEVQASKSLTSNSSHDVGTVLSPGTRFHVGQILRVELCLLPFHTLQKDILKSKPSVPQNVTFF